MKRFIIAIFVSALLAVNLSAQESVASKASKATVQALEVESLFPMFITGGFHVGVGYRQGNFRIRASIINGGSYDAESVGLRNSSEEFKRYYKTAPGVFIGYTIWKNLELYGHTEFHKFEIEQRSSGLTQNLRSIDWGGGMGYQLFLWKRIYVQPAFHIYIRKGQSLSFAEETETYKIPNVDLSPVIRIGYRLWGK